MTEPRFDRDPRLPLHRQVNEEPIHTADDEWVCPACGCAYTSRSAALACARADGD